jgi:hypothetical protein
MGEPLGVGTSKGRAIGTYQTCGTLQGNKHVECNSGGSALGIQQTC